MEGARTHRHVVGLEDDAPLFSPVALQRQDEVLERPGAFGIGQAAGPKPERRGSIALMPGDVRWRPPGAAPPNECTIDVHTGGPMHHNNADGVGLRERLCLQSRVYTTLAFGTAVAIGLGTAAAPMNSYNTAAGRFRITVLYRKEPKCLRLPMP